MVYSVTCYRKSWQHRQACGVELVCVCDYVTSGSVKCYRKSWQHREAYGVELVCVRNYNTVCVYCINYDSLSTCIIIK